MLLCSKKTGRLVLRCSIVGFKPKGILKMLTFLATLTVSVALLLGAQAMDIECEKPRKPPRAVIRAAAKDAGYPNAVTVGGAR